jgi:hypothetical protein
MFYIEELDEDVTDKATPEATARRRRRDATG